MTKNKTEDRFATKYDQPIQQIKGFKNIPAVFYIFLDMLFGFKNLSLFQHILQQQSNLMYFE